MFILITSWTRSVDLCKYTGACSLLPLFIFSFHFCRSCSDWNWWSSWGWGRWQSSINVHPVCQRDTGCSKRISVLFNCSVVMWRGIQKFYFRTNADSVHHEGTVNCKHWKLLFFGLKKQETCVNKCLVSVLSVWSKIVWTNNKLNWRSPGILVRSRGIS